MPLLGRAGGVKRSGPPWATFGLLLGLLIWQIYVTGGAGHADAPTLMQFGARKATRGFPQAPWRLMASVFLHFNWWHLLSNLLVLGVWGACLERLLGRLQVLVLFLLAGLWGSLLSDKFGPSILAMGASGAAFAMVTAVLALSVLGPDWPEWNGEAGRWLQVSVAALALNAVSALGFARMMPGALMDHWAHGGGALCGLLLGLAAALAGRDKRGPAFWGVSLGMTLTAWAILATRGSSPFAHISEQIFLT